MTFNISSDYILIKSGNTGDLYRHVNHLVTGYIVRAINYKVN